LIKNTNYFQFLPGKRLKQTGALDFDASTFEIWGTLTNGMTLYLSKKNTILSSERLKRRVQKYGIQILWMTSPLFNQMLEDDIAVFSTLETLLLGGDVLSPFHIEKLKKTFPGLSVINGYGPTENTTFSTTYTLPGGAITMDTIPIGTPISNSWVYIQDHQHRLKSIGGKGEIVVGGEGVARGYMNNSELTQKKFHEDPFYPGKKVYYTGDLGRWLESGDIEFLGRKDHQVKIRGFRVEPKEIEYHLLNHNKIKDAVVISRKNKKKENHLEAYVVISGHSNRSSDIEIPEIRKFLSGKLPQYMIPGVIIPINRIPLTPNGKVDLDKLSDFRIPEKSTSNKVMEGIPGQLAGIWAEVLEIPVENLDTQADFRDLGGDSLKMISLLSRIHQEFKVRIPVEVFFEKPLIRELSIIIEMSSNRDFEFLTPIEKKEYYRLSSAQKRMYALHQMHKQDLSYNIPMRYQLMEKPEHKKLDRAFQELIRRHESFRTSFHVLHNDVVQKVHPSGDFNFRLDYHRFDFPQMERKISEFTHSFDLESFPLLRAKLLEIGGLGESDTWFLWIDMHHIISDFISVELLKQELVELYEGRQLPPLYLQYKDYSEDQYKKAKTGKQGTKKEYWLNQLDGEIPELDLPIDFPRQSKWDTEGNSIYFSLGEKVTLKLEEIAKTERSTLFMVLLTIFNILLSKISNQEDIIVGIPSAGRTHVQLEGIIGMFVNTLAFRTYPKGGKTFLNFLNEVRERTIRNFDNQEFQFEELITFLGFKGKTDLYPLFRVMFQLLQAKEASCEPGNLMLSPYPLRSRVSKFDLNLNALKTRENLDFELEYSKKLFKESTIQRIVDYFKRISQTVILNPQIQLNKIEILSTREKERILLEFNDPKSGELKTNHTLMTLFARTVQNHRDRLAVISGDQALTYLEFDQRSNGMAQELIKKGLLRNEIVGIFANRSIERIIGLWATIRSEGVFLPISQRNPCKRVQMMLKDSGAGFLCLQRQVIESHPWIFQGLSADHILFLEPTPVSTARKDSHLPADNLWDPVYLIYTSGSTGQPKGVVVEQGSLVNLCLWHHQVFKVTERDRASQYADFGFDAAVWEIFPYLLKGASLAIVDEETTKDFFQLHHFYLENKITLSFLPTPVYEQFIREYDPPIRAFLTGGDQLKSYLRRRSQLYNNYGPTENTVVSTSLLVDKDSSNIPVGRPVKGTCVYILNHDFTLLQPIGVSGELCVSGLGLSRGYLNRVEMTFDRFIPDPFAEGKDPLYCTGDLARWAEDGNIEFLGRKDQQVKIRGYRIELGEIEKKILEYPGLRQACVAKRESDYSTPFLCAYVVSDVPVNPTQLKVYLSRSLPDYMIPLCIRNIKEIPVTINGKIDYQKLPGPEIKIKTPIHLHPADAIENKLVGIWGMVLGRKGEEIGKNENFFELGGHSLSVTVVISHILKYFHVRISIIDFFRDPYIRGLARIIRESEPSECSQIQSVEKKEYYPLSSGQRRLYFLLQLYPGNTSYNMPLILLFQKKVDPTKIKRSVLELLKTHPSLRTSFQMIQGKPFQRIKENCEIEIKIRRYEGEEKERKIISDSIQPFDLSEAPLVRVHLLILKASYQVLVMDMHHIISDGISLNRIAIEFFNNCQNEGKEHSTKLRLRYQDYSEWERKHRFSNPFRQNSRAEYWEKVFYEDTPILDLPLDFERPSIKSFEGDVLRFEITPKELKKLKSLAIEEEMTLFMILTGIATLFLSKVTGQEDIVLGTVSSARVHPELAEVVGFFLNMIPLRMFPGSQKSLREYLRETRKTTLEGFENQEFQYDDLVQHLGLNRDVGRNPLFDVVLVLQNIDLYQPEEPEVTMITNRFRFNASKFDLTFIAEETGGSLWINLEYSTELFRESTITRFIGYFRRCVTYFIEGLDKKISAIEVIDGREKNKLLNEFNKEYIEFPGVEPIPQLVDHQVRENPQTIVLVVKDQWITFSSLNEKSNQLGLILRRLGIKSNVIVGVLVERSVEMIVSMLGVIKAGGAVLSIANDYPEGRIAFLLRDSLVSVLLTQNQRESIAGERIIHIQSKNLESLNTTNLHPVNNIHDLVYILYTSGTTGRPKGVLIEHVALVNFIFSFNEAFQKKIGPGEYCLGISNISFDASICEIFLPLTLGSTLVLLQGREMLNVFALSRYLVKMKITFAFIPPLLLRSLSKTLEARPEKLPLDKLFVGAEPIKGSILADYLSLNPSMRIINGYGPAETTVCCTSYRFTGKETKIKNVPIGKTMTNTKIYLLGRDLEILPIGVKGEIFVGGEGLGRGYLNEPVITGKNFISSPFNKKKYLYRTGDLARWLPDGNLEFLGRVDHQVKIRGVRIEPGEIEAQLLRHRKIKEAWVVDVKNTDSGDSKRRFLCAYFVSTAELKVPELREYLLMELPDYMIPDYFVPIKKIPVNRNGKLDRNALPNPKSKRRSGDSEYTPPVTRMEELITTIWEEVLGLKKIGVYDKFFDLGGNSMDIIQLNLRMNEQIKIEIPVIALYRYTTIKSIAHYVNQEKTGTIEAPKNFQRKKEINRGKELRRLRLGKRKG
jgi:amino acid adenylation domain-containing protein